MAAAGVLRRILTTAAPHPLYLRLSGTGIAELVPKTIDDYVSSGGEVNRSQLRHFARQLIRTPKHALEIINWMEARNIGIGCAEHALRMKLITKLNGIDAAESYFNSLPLSVKNNKFTLGQLLSSYCKEAKVEKALQVFSTMDSMDIVDEVAPINSLIMLYVKIRQWEKVPHLMKEMMKKNIQPSTFTYNLLIHSYACLNDVEGVERAFEEMKRDNEVCCNLSTYDTLANHYIRVGLRGRAEMALKKMEEEMDFSNCESFHILISFYAKISDHENVHRIWGSLKSNFIQLTTTSYLTMLRALSKLNDIIGMKKCYEEWESTCSPFDIRLANTLIGTYLAHDKPDEAGLIFHGLLDRSRGPIFKACEYFMSYYLMKHQIKQALQYLEVASSKNMGQMWIPEKHNIDGFLRYFIKVNDVDHARQFCELTNIINDVHTKAYEWLLHKVLSTVAKEDSGTTNQNLGVLSGLFKSLHSTEEKVRAQSMPTWSDNSVYMRLSALGIDEDAMVAETIDGYISEGRNVDKSQLFNHCLQTIDWREAHGFCIGHKEHALRLKLINKVKGIVATENYFNSLPPSVKNTSTVLETLLSCYRAFNMIDEALVIFARMDSMNMIDASLPFTDLMTLYMKTGQPEKVPPLMEEMKKMNIQPSAYSYNLLMSSYSCVNDVGRVESIFEEMKSEKKAQFDWTAYSTLVLFYIRAGLQGKADATLEKMEEQMDSINSESFHFLISLYTKICNLQKVHHVWMSLKSKSKQVTSTSYLVMLQALSRLDDFNGMKKCYEEWVSECSDFDIRQANILIGTYLAHDKPDEAQLLFRCLRDRSQGPLFEACEHFINYYLKKEQIKQALSYLKVATLQKSDQRWQPKEDTVSGFLDYLKNHDDISSIKQFSELAKELNCIDWKLYNSLLWEALEKEKKAYDLLLMDILKDHA